jgi:hypothetical protein
MGGSGEQWAEVRDDRVADLIARFTELPLRYRTWVEERIWNLGLPSLRMSSQLGPGQVASWEALVSRCERELADRASDEVSV